MGYVNPPVKRSIGSIDFNSGKFNELISPNAFPNEIYSSITLRSSGAIHTKGNGDGAEVPLNPLTYLPSIKINVTGTEFLEMPAMDLYTLNMINRPDRNGKYNKIQSSTAAAGATPFAFNLPIHFGLNDMLESPRGYFRSGRYPTSKIRIEFGTGSDLSFGETGANTVAGSIDLEAETYTGEPGFENPPPRKDGQPPFVLHKRTNQIFPTNSVAFNQTRLEVPRDPSRLRGMLMTTYIAGPERPVALFEDTDVIQFKYNKNDMKYDETWGKLREENAERYGAYLPDGKVFFDLAPDGDWAKLRDTTNGVYELVCTSTNAIANALVRLSYVRYAVGL